MEALEAYDNLRSYSIDKELREVDDMLVKTSAPMRAELRELIKELDLENSTETTQSRSSMPERANSQSKKERTINDSGSSKRGDRELLAPASLMVLNVDRKDDNEESTRDAFDHPIDPHSIPNPQQDDAIRGSKALPH